MGKKSADFWIGCSVSHGGDTRGHCCEEQRLCLYPCGPECPLSSLRSAISTNTVWVETRALCLSLRGADAIIKLTHGHEEAHCARHAIFWRALNVVHLWRGGETKVDEHVRTTKRHLQRCMIVILSPIESENGLATRFIICEINSRLWVFSWPLWILGDLVSLCELQLSRFSSQDEIRPLIKLNLWISRQHTSEHVLKSKNYTASDWSNIILVMNWPRKSRSSSAGFVHSLNLNRPAISQNKEFVNFGSWKIVNVINWRVRCGTITWTIYASLYNTECA